MFLGIEKLKKYNKFDKNGKVRIGSILAKKDTFFGRWGELGENWKARKRRAKSACSGNWGELKANADNTCLYLIKNKGGFSMAKKNKYYDELRKQYPETISKDQFYRIAHISKATALYLLQSGLVPCEDSGKKTRRYTIRMDDVIDYMINREKHPEDYQAPVNWYKKYSGKKVSLEVFPGKPLKLSVREKNAFRKYIERKLICYDDLMKVTEVIEVIGYSDTSIHRWCREKKLKAFHVSSKFLIPKISLVDFLLSQDSFNIKRKSPQHIELIKSFFE